MTEILLNNLHLYITRAADFFLNVTQTIRDEGVSNYPIILAYLGEEAPEIGIPLPVRQEDWAFNASTLEELYTKNIIEMEKIDDFRNIYNHKSGHLCVLLINESLGADFVFVPISTSN